MHRTRRHPLRNFAMRGSLAFALVAIVAGSAQPGGADPAADRPKVVDRLSRFAPDAIKALGDRIKPAFSGDNRETYGGTLIGVPGRRQLWQIYPTSGSEPTPTLIAIRDMDSLKIIKTLELPISMQRGARSDFGGDWMHTFDGDRRLFLLGNGIDGRSTWAITEIDLATFSHKTSELTQPFVNAGRPLTGFLPAAMEFDPFSQAVLLLFGGVPATAAGNANTFVYRFTLADKQGAARQIRVCAGPLTPTDSGFTSQLGGIVTFEYVFFSCQRAGSIGAVARIKRSELFDQNSVEDIVAGPAYLETALADPGSGRIFLITIGGEIWAFDTATMAFVGVIAGGAAGAIDPRSGYGLDSHTGRLFFVSNTYGMGIAEGRFYPIPQARLYPDLAAGAQERIISDSKRGIIFVLLESGSKRAADYLIYETGQAPLPPPEPDPDRSTIDVAEQDGVTDSRFFANASGYGARVLLAKGIVAVPPAPTVGVVAPTADIIEKNLNSKCGYNDRELAVGRVSKAEYDTGSTAARAIGADVDERTKLDLAHFSRCDVTVRNGQEVFRGIFGTAPTKELLMGDPDDPDDDRDHGYTWNREAATCTSSEGGQEKSDDSKNEAPNQGHVECPRPGGTLEAFAVGQLAGGVTVQEARTTSTISRDDKGVVAHAVAEAQDVNIAGVIHIGEVTSIATSRSNGRPNKNPMSTHTLILKGVRTPDGWLCKDVCDENLVVRNLNILTGGRVEFRTRSGIDEKLKKGTLKGALTAVQKSTARQASDQALVGDATTEVAGLEMIMYNDNKPFGRARQIYQFAGVATAATYNIQRIPGGAGFDDLPGDGGFDDSALDAVGSSGEGFASGDGFATAPIVGGGGSDGGPVERFLRALGRGIRMFLTDPRQALLLLTAWGLFSLPPVLSRRRRLLAAARSH